MTILSATKLETATYGTPEWVAIYNANIYKLNTLLLKINALLDVDVDGLLNGSILRWNASTSKWKSYKV
jgi:hypothetical protein